MNDDEFVWAFLDVPVWDRRFVVVISDREALRLVAADAPETQASAHLPAAAGAAGAAAAAAAAFARMTPAGLAGTVALGLLGPAAQAFHERWRNRKSGGEPAVPLPETMAAVLDFPHGFERNRVYAVHPKRTDRYLPVERFHDLLLLDKAEDAKRVLMDAGATRIEMDLRRSQGLDTEAAADVTGADLGAGAGAERKRSTEYATIVEAPGKMIPEMYLDHYSWYGTEDSWQGVVRNRLLNRITRDEIEVTYMDDFGVNAQTTAMLERFGLKLRGDFKRFEQTRWRWLVTFPEFREEMA